MVTNPSATQQQDLQCVLVGLHDHDRDPSAGLCRQCHCSESPVHPSPSQLGLHNFGRKVLPPIHSPAKLWYHLSHHGYHHVLHASASHLDPTDVLEEETGSFGCLRPRFAVSFARPHNSPGCESQVGGYEKKIERLILCTSRACVAAAFRLQVTVVYGHATDGTYNLGSMIFWVMAEMTCAFFVVCVPTIPKILQDTGIIRSIKRRFGLTKTGPTGGSGYGTKGGLPTNRSIPTSTSKAYYMLDESGVEMGDVKSGSTSSTEHLRQEDKDNSTVAAPARGQIVRTTRITVNESAEAGYGRKEGYPARSWD